MSDGIYSITFRGLSDWGIGLLLLSGGTITGADAGGVLYDGHYQLSGSNIDLNVTLTVPPGVTLVQGTKPQPTPYTVPITASFPLSQLQSSQAQFLNTPLGPVNVIFRKLRGV